MANVSPLKISGGQIMQFQAGDTISSTIAPGGGGGSGATVGNTTVDFGAFPGQSDTRVVITGQAGILAGSVVNAWLRPEATADHAADEHLLETLKVFAGNIVPGTGFTVYVLNASQLNEPLGTFSRNQVPVAGSPVPDNSQRIGGIGTRIYGLWSVSWSWQ